MRTKPQIFSDELKAIQKRHPRFFVKEDLKYIKMIKVRNGYSLQIDPRVDLDGQILMEIELAFKLSAM